jgi:hypothetical protein
LLGISLAFALTFCITEAINAELCSCGCARDPDAPAVLASSKQVIIIFVGALLMGAIYGLIFGSLDVEKDGPQHTRFKTLLLVSIPIGSVMGGTIGNATITTKARVCLTISPNHTVY